MKQAAFRVVASIVAAVAAVALLVQTPVAAQVANPGPTSSSTGVEGKVPSPPPTTPATIVGPAGGATFDATPISVTGSCPAGTIIKIFSNNVFVGAVDCVNGSYTMQISLFSGRNDIIARIFDSLDQEGPISQQVTIYFNDRQVTPASNYVFLTSQYARRAADPNTALVWPIILSNGMGPYALSIDWGDNTPSELHSESFAGALNYTHTYKLAGIYRVTYKVVDKNGNVGFLQVISVVSGQTGTNKTTGNQSVITQTKILWWPVLLMFIPVLSSFWLGRRYELVALRKRLEREYR